MVGGGQISHNSYIKRFFVQVLSCITTWKGCTLKMLTNFFALVHAMPYWWCLVDLLLHHALHFITGRNIGVDLGGAAGARAPPIIELVGQRYPFFPPIIQVRIFENIETPSETKTRNLTTTRYIS